MFENSLKIEFLSQMQTKNGWNIEKQGLQNGYLRFLNFAFLTPNISKNDFFLEKWSQNPKFSKFSKTGIYVVELAVFNQFAKFQLDTIIFDPQKGCFCLPHSAQWWRHTFKCNFLKVIANLQEN